MVCDEFQSEIARLVYGYLVKENLTELALKFLTGSQYLQNCLRINATGVSLESKDKLLDKNLDELLEEYSIIHNIVNSKINLLPKTSELYIEINLNCDNNLRKKIEVLLNSFISDTENLEVQKDKNSNSTADSSGDFSDKNNADSNSVSENENRENNDDDGNYAEEESDHYKEPPPNENNDYNSENNYDGNVDIEIPSHNSESHKQGDDNRTLNDKNNEYHEIQNDKNLNDNIPKNLGDSASVTFHNDTNQCLTEEAMEVDSVSQYVGQNQNEGNIKILRIETQSRGETQTLSLYPDSLSGNEMGINENSPVVFVDSSVGNFGINQDSNQIIVIPIDSYGAAFEDATASHENQDEVIVNSANLNCSQQRDLSYQVISDNPQTVSANTGLCNSTRVENPVIDSNIITENDFLKNKEIIYDTCSAPATTAIIPNEIASTSGTVQQPILIVPQTRERFRKILPKEKEKRKEYSPAVVFVPMLNNISDAKTSQDEVLVQQQEQQQQQQPPQSKPTRQLRQRESNSKKKKGGKANNKKMTESEKSKNLNMPNLSSILLDESPDKSAENLSVIIKTTDQIEEPKNKNSEEKENQEEKEPSKIETPLVLNNTRNSKRLSLSTPRRRSHIRALEFETPPKTNDEKKKSQTSPKNKVDQVTVERKSVRNTLFKSPDPETVFKSPMCLKNGKKVNQDEVAGVTEPLNELSIPIATRSPKVASLSETWDKITGVGCVLEKPETVEENEGNGKKSWDSDLRCFIALNHKEIDNNEKKRVRKPEKVQKDNKKPGKKKLAGKKSKTSPAMGSSTKMSLTAKRNTYSISENEEKSPVRGLQDDLKLITPFKDPEPIRPMEETPLTKLLRENINGIDIDLSMINTPIFPPTPSILITPDLDDLGTSYYTPLKDDAKNKTVITECLQVDKTKKQETKENHEKVIEELVTKAKEIIGIRPAEENTVKKPPSGKILSMVKVQMITQCDKKLCANIPINESVNFSDTAEKTLIENLGEEMSTTDLKVELSEKRERTVKKIKEVKENLSTRNKVTRNLRKRKRSGGDTGVKQDKKLKLDNSSDTTGEKLTESDESIKQDAVMIHSTPYADRVRPKFEKTGKSPVKDKPDQKTAEEILQELPSFQDDNTDRYPELGFKSRKKIHFVENFLKLDEVAKFLESYNEKNPGKLDLRPSFKKFVQIFYKWLKHPHQHEVNASDKTKKVLNDYLTQFEKINKGLKNKKCKKDGGSDKTNNRKSSLDVIFKSYGGNKSEDEEAGRKEIIVKKDEELEDGVVSTLPLKKRKANVQAVEKKESRAQETPEDLSTTGCENLSQTQNFLQNIDVDGFLTQLHGQNNR